MWNCTLFEGPKLSFYCTLTHNTCGLPLVGQFFYFQNMGPVYSSLLVNSIDVKSKLNLHAEFRSKLQTAIS